MSVTLSTLVTNIWWEPDVVCRQALGGGLGQYFRLLVRYRWRPVSPPFSVL